MAGPTPPSGGGARRHWSRGLRLGGRAGRVRGQIVPGGPPRRSTSHDRRVTSASAAMEPVRFGLVGYGFGGRYFHAPLIGAAAECEFLGVVTTSPERQALVAPEHPAVRTFASLAELKAAGAEAVAISTPADTHTTLSEQALELGLAVVCDKPFALDAAVGPGDGRAGRAARAVAGAVPEPALGLRLPHRPRAGGRRALGELARFESRFERLAPDDGTRSRRRRHAARLRRPPGGPGARTARAGDRRSTPSGGCATTAWTTTCSSRSPTPAAPGRTCGAAGARERRARGTGSPARPAAT